MTPLHITGLTNAYQVDDKIWRSAQPPDASWPLIAAAGAKVVFDLNSSGTAISKQAELVTATGMHYYSFPWSGIVPPTLLQVQQSLERADEHQGPILVHCEHGSDRTGTWCACWRMHHDGWKFDAAIDEAFTALGLRGMHEFWMAAAAASYAKSIGADY